MSESGTDQKKELTEDIISCFRDGHQVAVWYELGKENLSLDKLEILDEVASSALRRRSAHRGKLPLELLSILYAGTKTYTERTKPTEAGRDFHQGVQVPLTSELSESAGYEERV